MNRFEKADLIRANLAMAEQLERSRTPEPGDEHFIRMLELAAAELESWEKPNAWAEAAFQLVVAAHEGEDVSELLANYRTQQQERAARQPDGTNAPECALVLVRFRDGSQRALEIANPTHLQVEAEWTVTGEADVWAVRAGTGVRVVTIRGLSEPLDHDQLAAVGVRWRDPLLRDQAAEKQSDQPIDQPAELVQEAAK